MTIDVRKREAAARLADAIAREHAVDPEVTVVAPVQRVRRHDDEPLPLPPAPLERAAPPAT
eukprot:6198675-Pleurochrysis_carterae.AAC.3